MSHSLHFWLRLLLLFLGLLGCIWTANIVWKRRQEDGLGKPIITVMKWNKIYTSLMNTGRVALGVLVGMAIVNLYQYHNLEVVSNVVIDSQQGNYVEYHYKNDPTHQTYGWHFCSSYVPHFEPKQIVDHMVFVIEPSGCEDISPYKASLKLVRLKGVPVLEKDEGDE